MAIEREGKPTRQWDAWTREEEENFFGALRQVGKNFEKITSRVQSKNKDQVRHYYYRVIKRMNRILAPTLILDAKNSTYVNSAMLRWWSLLEKHSCSASKLRLKPRRFKTFVTALEHQLLKDHKKVKIKKPTPAAVTSRKQSSNADPTAVVLNGPPEFATATSGSGLSKAAVDDLQTVQTPGVARRAAVKRKSSSNGPRKSGPKGEAKRPPRPRKKATDGNLSKAAYAKWEKAASVGVSLMAEAAEQLERASAAEPILTVPEASEIHSTSTMGGNNVNMDVQTGQIPPGTSAAFSELGLTDKTVKELPCGLPAEMHVRGDVLSRLSRVACSPQKVSFSSTMPLASPSLMGPLPNVGEGVPGGLVIIPELCAQVKAKSLALDATRCNNCSTLRCNGAEEVKNDMPGAKLKLQLFPFDDFTRKALEKDGHNPHLELTFKARKSISSVLHHLTQKWGRSTVASGELRLFPFNTQWSNVSACQSWSYQDLNISAADVHAALGNPAVFRLRYAWLSTRLLESSCAVLQQQHMHADNVAIGSGPVLSDGTSYPDTTGITTSQHVLPQASTGQGVFVGTSMVTSTEPCKPSEIEEILPQTAGSCGKEDASDSTRHTISVHATIEADVHVGVPSLDSVCLVLASEQLVGKSPSSNGMAAATLESNTDKDFVQRLSDLASFADGEAETANKANCKEHESGSQVSGCGWLYESNDGFAQQLWNYEDTLRGSTGVSIAQMDWVDSLTNISVSELLGDASRAVFSAPLDCPQPCSGQAQLNYLDSFDISVAGREVPSPGHMLMHTGQTSSAIWGGEETCDAFSFQRLDRCNKEAVNSIGEETCPNSLGLDVSFADFRSMSCWREVDSFVAVDVGQQAQNSQSQDIFGGDASMGLGGLIEALAQGSLDGFQVCSFNHDVDKQDPDQAVRQDCDTSTEARVENGGVFAGVSSKDGNGLLALGNIYVQGRTDDLSNGNSELIEIFERLPETTVPNVTAASEGLESLKDPKPVNARLVRKKELHPPQRSFKMPGQYSTVRSLKLQG